MRPVCFKNNKKKIREKESEQTNEKNKKKL